MGQYRSAVITDAGQALLADAISGSGTVTFSAVKTSSYAYPQGTNIAGLTDLQDIVQTVTPFSAQVFNDTMLQVSARFDNSGVASAYLIQTLGAYAQIGDNDPVLFAVVQANTPDQMPMQSPVSPSAFIYNIQITVQQASQITVTVNPAGTATVQDILTLSAQKVDVNGGELSETETSFDDSGSVSGITSFPAFLATFLSKTKTGIFLRNLKAGLQFILHVGSIVNNCVTDNAELPLSAAQGKVLMDLYTVLNTKAQNLENTKADTILGDFGAYKDLGGYVRQQITAEHPILIVPYPGKEYADCPLAETWGTIVAVGAGSDYGKLVICISNYSRPTGIVYWNVLNQNGGWVFADWNVLS